jgi:glyoxylase-like metal-dependent hydrolase (beta-lactamase superfamily II)
MTTSASISAGRDCQNTARRDSQVLATAARAEQVLLRDRSAVLIRQVSSADAPLLADGFDRLSPRSPTQLLTDGDTLDLGGRKLHVLHTPGHTVDGISLYDDASGALFGGDTIMAGPIYTHLPTGDPADLARSARRLASELRGQLRTIYCQHMLRYSMDAAFLPEVADGAEQVVQGVLTPVRGTDILGQEVTEYWFDRFSITTPAL